MSKVAVSVLKDMMEPVESELFDLYQLRDTLQQVISICGYSAVDHSQYSMLCEKILRYEQLLVKAKTIIEIQGGYTKDA